MEGQKRLRRNKGRHSKINKKMPFFRGKTVFSLRSKERNKKNNTKKKTKKTKKTKQTNKKPNKKKTIRRV